MLHSECDWKFILVTIGFAFICAANALSAGMHGQFHDLLMEMKSEVVNEQVCFFAIYLTDRRWPHSSDFLERLKCCTSIWDPK